MRWGPRWILVILWFFSELRMWSLIKFIPSTVSLISITYQLSLWLISVLHKVNLKWYNSPILSRVFARAFCSRLSECRFWIPVNFAAKSALTKVFDFVAMTKLRIRLDRLQIWPGTFILNRTDYGTFIKQIMIYGTFKLRTRDMTGAE